MTRMVPFGSLIATMACATFLPFFIQVKVKRTGPSQRRAAAIASSIVVTLGSARQVMPFWPISLTIVGCSSRSLM